MATEGRHEYETSAEVLAALGIPVAGEVTEIDGESGRLVLQTERGSLEVQIEADTAISVGDVICVCMPIGVRTS
jgi:hypothetical protein